MIKIINFIHVLCNSPNNDDAVENTCVCYRLMSSSGRLAHKTLSDATDMH